MSEFAVGETVITSSDGEFYTAKILAVENDNYKLHYTGWSSKYDTWVVSENILKMNDMNLALVNLERQDRKSNSIRKFTQYDLLSEIDSVANSATTISFPFLLKQRLIEDWYIITSLNQFIPIPRKPSIMTILQLYALDCNDKSLQIQQNANDLIQMILYYVNTYLDKSLLYAVERDQFEKVKAKQHVTYAEVYGAEHLLRLLYIIPTLYSSSELSEKDISLVHEIVMYFVRFLMCHPEFFCSKEEYCTNEECLQRIDSLLVVCYLSIYFNSIFKHNYLMQPEVIVSEVFKTNTYNKLGSQRYNKCISIAEEGNIAIAEQSSCWVINPYLQSCFQISSGKYPVIPEKQETKSKKTIKNNDNEETTESASCAYSLVGWTPSSIGYNKSSFLLTITYSAEVKLWAIPFSYFSFNMTEIADLTKLITSTSIFTSNYHTIHCCSYCFSKSDHELAISLNNLLFIFHLEWKMENKPVLLIQLQKAMTCLEDIESLFFYDNTYIYGSSRGHLYRILSHSQQNESIVFPDTLLIHERDDTEEYIESSSSFQSTFPSFSIICSSSLTETSVHEILLISSIQPCEHPFQRGLSDIQVYQSYLVVSDHIHIAVINPSDWSILFTETIPDGFFTSQCMNNNFYCISSTYKYIQIDLHTHQVIQCQSLLSSLKQYWDYSLLNACPIPYSSQPGFMILVYELSGVRTTTVDYRFQYLSLYCIAEQHVFGTSNLVTTVPEKGNLHFDTVKSHKQSTIQRKQGNWYPWCVYQPFFTCFSSIQPEAIYHNEYSIDNLYLYHITGCYLLHCRNDLVNDHICACMIAIQKKLLSSIHSSLATPSSKWLVYKLGFSSEEKGNEEECSCCKRQVVVNEGHSEWCPFNSFDNYCCYTLQPIITTIGWICPCCLHFYSVDKPCIFCNLHLYLADQSLQTIPMIGLEILQKRKKN